jgi:hypothetical protein
MKYLNYLESMMVILLVAIVCSGRGQAQTAYTNPVGYETLTARPGKATLLGLRLHSPALVVGVADSISGNLLTHGTLDFDSTLNPALTSYVVELRDGVSNGRVIDILAVDGNTLTLAEVLPTQSNVLFTVRAERRLGSDFMTLSSVIDPTEAMGTDDFNPDNADLVLIPSGGGKFKHYFVSTFFDPLQPDTYNQWINAETGLPEKPHVPYVDAFFYLRRDSSDFLPVISGEIKLHDTMLSVTGTFNYFSSVYPVGMTLAESNLAASLQAGTAESADIVWIQDEAGDFHQYFVSDGTPPLTAGWRQVAAPPGSGDADQADVPMSPGFVIHRRAVSPYDALMTPPDFYSTL